MHSYTAVKDLMCFHPGHHIHSCPLSFCHQEYLVKTNCVAAQHYNQDIDPETHTEHFHQHQDPSCWPFTASFTALPFPRTDHFNSFSDKVIGFPLAVDSLALAFKFKQIFKNSQNGNQEGNIFQSTKPSFLCNL